MTSSNTYLTAIFISNKQFKEGLLMLSFLKKVFRRKEPSIDEVPEMEFVTFEDLEEWKDIKVYNRNNSEKKQIFYKNNYICSCSSEEVTNIKNWIIKLVLDGMPLELIKENVRGFCN